MQEWICTKVGEEDFSAYSRRGGEDEEKSSPVWLEDDKLCLANVLYLPVPSLYTAHWALGTYST